MKLSSITAYTVDGRGNTYTPTPTQNTNLKRCRSERISRT